MLWKQFYKSETSMIAKLLMRIDRHIDESQIKILYFHRLW